MLFCFVFLRSLRLGLALDSWQSSLSFPSTEITGEVHYA